LTAIIFHSKQRLTNQSAYGDWMKDGEGKRIFAVIFLQPHPFAEQEAGYKNTPQMAKRFSSEAEYRSSPTALCTTCMNPTVEGIVEVEMTFTSFVTTATRDLVSCASMTKQDTHPKRILSLNLFQKWEEPLFRFIRLTNKRH
jgi:hypothetical protein